MSMDVKLVKLFLQLETETIHAPKCELKKMNVIILLISEVVVGRSSLAEEEIKHHIPLPWFFIAFLFLESIGKLSLGCAPLVGIYIPAMMKLVYVFVSVFCVLSVTLVIMHFVTLGYICYVFNCNAVRLNSLKHF